PHLAAKVALRRLRRHVDARAGDVELPSVVDAAQALLLVAAEEHGSAAVGTGILEQAHAPGGAPECNEVLAEQAHTQGCPVRSRQLFAGQEWDPELPHEVAHGRARPDLA